MTRQAAAMLAATALLGTAAGAQEAAHGGLVCRPAGYDVVVVNEGPEPLMPGTVVAWEVPFARASGTVALTSILVPGGQVVLTAVLGSTYLAGPRPCTAEARPAAGRLAHPGAIVAGQAHPHDMEDPITTRG
jgi:hypothetical protein